MGQTDDDLPLNTAAAIAGERCRTLWIAVLLLAMQDAARGDAQAQAWLGTACCRWICSAVGVDVRWVRSYETCRLVDGERRLSASLTMRRRPRE